MADPSKEQEYREEAERLVEMLPADQSSYLAWQRDIADNHKLREADREAAAARIKALKLAKRRKTH